jgi:CheY-like chemotaxis protein
VLVIDDNVDAAHLVVEALHCRGHTAEMSIGGVEGLSKAMEASFDAVVLDIGMPLLDGYEVALALRKAPETKHLLLIALTAWGDMRAKARTKACGFDLHLVKPASLEAIFEAVEQGGGSSVS